MSLTGELAYALVALGALVLPLLVAWALVSRARARTKEKRPARPDPAA